MRERFTASGYGLPTAMTDYLFSCACSQVDPIELVVWLPAVCKKMGVPYLIVKVPWTLNYTASNSIHARLRFKRRHARLLLQTAILHACMLSR